jgi:5-methylcytosine-specific restriction endonuclease McrA
MSSRARNTYRYQQAREQAKRRAGYQCERCGSTHRIHAHHITRLNDGGSVTDLMNLIVLCERCHFAEHRAKTVKPSPRFSRSVLS